MMCTSPAMSRPSLILIKGGPTRHLPCPSRAVTIAAMPLSRSVKALVALLTAITLLMCHAAFALQLGHGTAQEATADTHGHDHHRGHDGHEGHEAPALDPVHCHAADHDGTGGTRSAPCDSAQAVGDSYKPPAVAVGEWAPLVWFFVVAPLALASPLRTGEAALAGAPPPLHLLYSRFLN